MLINRKIRVSRERRNVPIQSLTLINKSITNELFFQKCYYVHKTKLFKDLIVMLIYRV